MKKIKLTQGKYTIIDDEDFELVNKYKWLFNTRYVSSYEKGKTHATRKRIFLHRLIMNTPKGMDTDHVNRNPLDNRRQNLRICTRSQNTIHSIRKNKTSKFRGVSWNKRDSIWQSTIGLNGKWTHIGNYTSEKEAALAYDKVVKTFHGEFAVCNF